MSTENYESKIKHELLSLTGLSCVLTKVSSNFYFVNQSTSSGQCVRTATQGTKKEEVASNLRTQHTGMKHCVGATSVQLAR